MQTLVHSHRPAVRPVTASITMNSLLRPANAITSTVLPENSTPPTGYQSDPTPFKRALKRINRYHYFRPNEAQAQHTTVGIPQRDGNRGLGFRAKAEEGRPGRRGPRDRIGRGGGGRAPRRPWPPPPLRRLMGRGKRPEGRACRGGIPVGGAPC